MLAYDDGNASRLGFPIMIVLGSIRVIHLLQYTKPFYKLPIVLKKKANG